MEHPKDCTSPRTPPISASQADQSVQFYKNFIAGGIAGAISRTVVSPLERAKILFQVPIQTLPGPEMTWHMT